MISMLRAPLGGELLALDMVRSQFTELYPMFGTPKLYGLGVLAYELPGGALW